MNASSAIHRLAQKQKARSKLVFRRVFYSVFGFYLFYIPFFEWLGAKLSSRSLMIILALGAPAIFILDKRNKETAAKTLFIAICGLTIFFTSLGIGHLGRVEFYCFPAILLALLFFEFKDYVKYIFTVFVVLISWVLIEANVGILQFESLILSEVPYEFIARVNFLGTLALTSILLKIFISTSLRTQVEKITALEATKKDLTRSLVEKTESEEKFKSVVGVMGEGLVLHAADGSIIEANQAALEILGLSEDELFGRSSFDPRWHAIYEDGSPFPGEMHPAIRALKLKQPFKNVVMGLKQLSGSIKWISISAIPFYVPRVGQAEEELRVAVTFSDISKTTQAIQELAESNKELDNFFNISIDLMCIASPNGHFLRVNPAFTRILGFSEAELLSRPIVSFVHSEDVDKTAKEIEKLANGVMTVNFENRYICKDGTRKILSWTAALDKSSGRIYAAARDITEMKLKKLELNQLMETVTKSTIVSITDKAGKIIAVNDNFCQISGYSREELIGKNHRIIKSDAHPRSFYVDMWKTISSGHTWFGEVQNKTKSGKPYFVHTVITPMHDVDGNIDRYFSIRVDITKSKEDEALKAAFRDELSDRRNFLEAVLDNIPSMIFVKDYQNGLKFSLLNKAGEDLLGLKSGDVIDKSDRDFFPPEQSEFFMRIDREVFSSKKVLHIERESIQTPKGTRILNTYKVPTFKSDGSPHLLIGISTDITEELTVKEALELERLKSIQSSKLAVLGEMSAGVAHEINNPLAVISASVPLIQRSASDPEKLNSIVDKVTRSTERIAKIVKSLKKFSRTSDYVQHKEEVLCDLVQEAVQLTEYKARKYDTLIQVQCDTSAAVLCDAVEIEQVLINLIHNAIDAVRGLPSRWVKIRVFENNSEVLLHVIDAGDGIPASTEAKMFNPFFTTKPIGEGTGLGLSICWGILKNHNASIGVNREFANTCFEIRFQKMSPS